MEAMTTPISVTTPGGEVTVPVDVDGIRDNFELVELLRAAQEDAAAMVDVYRVVYGDAYGVVKEACRDSSGKVSADAMADAFAQLSLKVAALKN